MAKIFRTEELSVNGDFIRISAEDGNLIFKDKNSNVVTSTDIRTQEGSSLAFKDGSLDTDVSSLKTEISDSVATANSDLNEDISSLQAQRTSDENTNDTEISSLQAQRVSDEATKTQEVSSLAFKDSSLDTDVSSLAALAATNDVRINNVALVTGDGDSKAVTFAEAFPAGVTPAVVGLMKAGSGDPILGVQLSAVSNTGATFQFSDDIPADNTYTLVVMASA